MLTIKDLAGHQSLETTMRHMYLSAAAPRQAIHALEVRGDVGEAEAVEEKKPSGSRS